MDDEKPATAVEKYFFTPLYYPRSGWSVWAWWEKRRPLYNLAVGAAGMTTLLSTFLVWGRLEPAALALSLVYGLAANVLYTAGPLADVALRRLLGDRAPAVGPAMFRYGFVFSVGLTLLPIPVMVFGKIMQLLFG